jgi:hypothetical protein
MLRKVVLILLVAVVVYIFWQVNRPEGENYSDGVPTVRFPFKNLFDENGKKLNVILISAPFREREHEKKYEEYKSKGMAFCGISSYLTFPMKITNPYDNFYHVERKHRYTDMVSAWLHCFRDPPEEIRRLPHLLLAEADLKNLNEYHPDKTIKKEYDLMYLSLSDNNDCRKGWNWVCRNFDLALKCFEKMNQRPLKILVVGREGCKFPNAHQITQKQFLPFHEFAKEMKKCRALFLPNVLDAYPRVLAEALCYDLPVLVNHAIVGGWSAVVPGVTGEFFRSEEDVLEALDKVLTGKYTPRKWYEEHRGLQNSGKELAKFLVKHYPNLNNKEVQCASITI